MFYRYACPACEADLKDHPPMLKKTPWYKLLIGKRFVCPHCGAEIEQRFTTFDGGIAFALMVLAGSSGFIGIWRLSKYFIPLFGILFALRMLAGRIFTVYVRVQK